MINYVRTTANHLVYIHEQEAQKGDIPIMLSPWGLKGFTYSAALTGFVGTKCLGCAGLIDGDDRVMLWALLSKDAGPYFVEITRKVLRVLGTIRGKRLVANVRSDFSQGKRWMKVLGFVSTGERVKVAGSSSVIELDVYEREAR